MRILRLEKCLEISVARMASVMILLVSRGLELVDITSMLALFFMSWKKFFMWNFYSTESFSAETASIDFFFTSKVLFVPAALGMFYGGPGHAPGQQSGSRPSPSWSRAMRIRSPSSGSRKVSRFNEIVYLEERKTMSEVVVGNISVAKSDIGG